MIESFGIEVGYKQLDTTAPAYSAAYLYQVSNDFIKGIKYHNLTPKSCLLKVVLRHTLNAFGSQATSQ